MTQRGKERKELKRLAIASATFLSAVFALHNVAVIYSGNSESFSFGLKHIFLVALAAFVVTALVLSLPAVVLRNAPLRVYAYSLCFLAAAAWIYSGFLVWDFGHLDGGGWDFSKFDKFRFYEISGLIAAWFAFYKVVVNRPRVFTYLFLFLNVALTVPTALALVRDPNQSSLQPRPNLEAIFRFSRQQNVLIVLMDAFQSDLFDDLLKENSSLAKAFTGFTYFPDTVGVAASTYLTLPSIHSGQIYQAGTNLREFYAKNIREGSFLNDLAAAGHEVTLVNPIQGECPQLIELCIESDEVLHGKGWALLMETASLLDLSLLRMVPLFYKKAVYNEQFWVIAPLARAQLGQLDRNQPEHVAANRVLEKIAAQGGSTGDRPVTKFIHLLSTHPPYVLDSACQVRGDSVPDRRVAARLQAKCAVEAFTQLLDYLRREGLYDRSLILLIADTGAGLTSSYAARDPKAPMWGRLVGRANPIFLAKPPGAEGALRQSAANVQPSDLAATVCAIVRHCHDHDGISVFSTMAMAKRSRIFRHYTWRNVYWNLDALTDIREFEVEGPVWERQSWTNYTRSDRGRF